MPSSTNGLARDTTVLQYASKVIKVVKPNNQNSVLLKYPETSTDWVALMHDNRIYYFETNNDEHAEAIRKLIINNILVRSKYRLLQTIYLVLRVLEDITFLGIIFSAAKQYLPGLVDSSTEDLQTYLLFMVFLFDITVEILNWTTKLWILNRFSLYIAILLFFVYYFLIQWRDVPTMVYWLVFARFIILLIDTIVDYCIDFELHIDMKYVTLPAKPANFWAKKVHCLQKFHCFCFNVLLKPVYCIGAKDYTWEDEKLALLREYYKGSICCWNFTKVIPRSKNAMIRKLKPQSDNFNSFVEFIQLIISRCALVICLFPLWPLFFCYGIVACATPRFVTSEAESEEICVCVGCARKETQYHNNKCCICCREISDEFVC